MSTKELSVLINDVPIGMIRQDAHGNFNFAYDAKYLNRSTAVPLSLSMPLTAQKHPDKAIRPFMWGLLPDNDDTLAQWGRRFSVSPRNPFALLSHIGEGLLAGGGKFRLAPLYDIASGLPYSRNRREERLAMSVDGHYHFERILPRHWEAEARKCGFDPNRAVAHVRDLLARLPDEARSLFGACKKEGSATPELAKLVDLMITRCAGLAERYGAEEIRSAQRRLPGV